jgi:Tol biopolymer transport system component
MSTLRAVGLALCLSLSASPAARAAQDDVLTAQDVARLRNATSAVISPDGKTIAYTLAVPRKPLADEDGPSWSELHVVDVASGASRPFVTGKVNVSALEWLPDGSAIAFLAKRGDDKNAALYVIALEGGEARKRPRSATRSRLSTSRRMARASRWSRPTPRIRSGRS